MQETDYKIINSKQQLTKFKHSSHSHSLCFCIPKRQKLQPEDFFDVKTIKLQYSQTYRVV